MTTLKSGVGTLAVALCLATPGAVEGQKVDWVEIDETVERIREEIGVPGIALAVVRGDSVVHSRGYGVREIGRPEPVDTGTVFAIGSATKAFTATLLGMLVGEGRLGWDDRVVDRLPGFSLHDPATTARLTVRDLLAHRSGLPPANLMWLTRPVDPDTLLHRLRWLEPAAGIRSTFTYQNLLYLAAGRIAEEITGRSWSRLVTGRILEPLGMATTSTSVDSLAGRRNIAVPHVAADGTTTTVSYRDLDHVGPAGSINSNVADLTRWLRFLLAGGEWNGEPLIGEEAFGETTAPQMVVPADPVMRAFHPAARLQTYGMGWFITDFHGRTLLAHGGGIDGMSALVAWVPEEGLGVAILSNLQARSPAWIFGILYGVLDPVLGVERTDWRGPAASLDSMLARMTVSAAPERVAATEPSLPPARFAGTYAGRVLGEAQIEVTESGEIVFEHGTLTGTLEHWHHDTFRVRWNDTAWRAAAGAGWITFRLGRSGDVESLELVALPGESRTLRRVGNGSPEWPLR